MKAKIALLVIGVLAVLTFITVGGYQLNWWLRGQEANRSAQIDQNTYGRQNALTEAVLTEIRQLEDPNLPPAQRTALVAEMCNNAAKLTGSITLPQTTITFIAKECTP